MLLFAKGDKLAEKLDSRQQQRRFLVAQTPGRVLEHWAVQPSTHKIRCDKATKSTCQEGEEDRARSLMKPLAAVPNAQLERKYLRKSEMESSCKGDDTRPLSRRSKAVHVTYTNKRSSNTALHAALYPEQKE